MTTVKFTFHQMMLIPWYDSFLLKLGKRKREREGWGERDSEIFGNGLPRLRGWPSAEQGGRQGLRGCRSLDIPQGSRLGTRAGTLCCHRGQFQIPSSLRRRQSLLLRPSEDGMRPPHVMKGNGFTQSLLLQMSITSTKNTFTTTSRPVSDQTAGHRSPAKRTRKRNHRGDRIQSLGKEKFLGDVGF